MGKHACLALALLLTTLAPAAAQQFALQTGPPVAAMPDPGTPGKKKLKDIAFVVRATGCDDPGGFRLTAAAASLVNDRQQLVAVDPLALPQAGIFAIHAPGHTGTWVVSLAGTCGSQTAGATVRLTNGAYRRDDVDLLPHHPTADDVMRALTRSGG